VLLPEFRSEFRKLATVRGPWLLLAAVPLTVVAGVSGLAQSGANFRDPSLESTALEHVGLAAIFTLIFGITAVAGEYRSETITDSYLSFPGRRQVIAGKLAIYGLGGAAAGVVAALVAVAVAAAWWAAKGQTFHLGAPGVWPTLGGGVAVNVAFALIGVCAGALIRNLAAAIATALAWIVLVEGIVGELLGSGLARWLPYYASEALDRANITGANGMLPQWAGGVVLLGYAVAFAAAALITTIRRDVT
jgi:ABC-2 type transport system permease protein